MRLASTTVTRAFITLIAAATPAAAQYSPPATAGYKFGAVRACNLDWPLADIAQTIDKEAQQKGITRLAATKSALEESESLAYATTLGDVFKSHFCTDMERQLGALGE